MVGCLLFAALKCSGTSIKVTTKHFALAVVVRALFFSEIPCVFLLVGVFFLQHCAPFRLNPFFAQAVASRDAATAAAESAAEGFINGISTAAENSSSSTAPGEAASATTGGCSVPSSFWW